MYESIKALENKSYIVFNLVFADNSILSFFAQWVIAQFFISTTELKKQKQKLKHIQ